MRYYLQVGQNTRILNPGDFFICRNGQNHTYEEVALMSKNDRERLGVYELDEQSIAEDYNTDTVLGDINAMRDMKIQETFVFRTEKYKCTARDVSTINILLSCASDRLDDNWLSPQIPFFWVNKNGDIRYMDVAIFKEFAKSMAQHIVANTLAALVLSNKVLAGEVIDIQDPNNWPAPKVMSTNYSYEEFSRRYIEVKYGNLNGIVIDQNQFAYGYNPVSTEPDMTFEEIESILNDLKNEF